MRKRLRSYINLIGFTFLMIVGVVVIYLLYDVEWSGFGPQVNPPFILQAKTLWDWLQLLIVPAMLGAVGIAFNVIFQRSENEKREDNQREYALQNYLEYMGNLILERKLNNSDIDDNVTRLARARTLTALRGLDTERKAVLLTFLYEVELIGKEGKLPIIDLNTADLRGAQLKLVHLEYANLGGASLEQANFEGAYLIGTNFEGANIEKANFKKARLFNAHLDTPFDSGANFKGAEGYRLNERLNRK